MLNPTSVVGLYFYLTLQIAIVPVCTGKEILLNVYEILKKIRKHFNKGLIMACYLYICSKLDVKIIILFDFKVTMITFFYNWGL